MASTRKLEALPHHVAVRAHGGRDVLQGLAVPRDADEDPLQVGLVLGEVALDLPQLPLAELVPWLFGTGYPQTVKIGLFRF